jgi:hypothetical protein
MTKKVLKHWDLQDFAENETEVKISWLYFDFFPSTSDACIRTLAQFVIECSNACATVACKAYSIWATYSIILFNV